MSDERSRGMLAAERLEGARRPLEQATTLPAEAFTDPAVYEREIRRIFSREWLCAGRADQIPAPGDYLTLDLLDERLVLVRDTQGRVRALSRVCRHRGAEVVRGAGNARSFQCPYHAWTYRLDGRLAGAPLMHGAENFERESFRLPEIRSELWEGWIFVNFDPQAAPLGPQLAPLSKQLAGYRMSEMRAAPTASFESPFNWKVLVDNFMEAYHHIAIHRDTFEPLFPAALSHTTAREGPYSVLWMPGRPDGSSPEGAATSAVPALPHPGRLDAQEAHQLVAAVVFPCHLFAPSAGALTWYQILPKSWDHFTLRIFSCFSREALDDPQHRKTIEALQAFTRLVHQQDIAACEAVWSGLRSPSFSAGRLSPLEKSIWHFNQWWIERMADGEPEA